MKAKLQVADVLTLPFAPMLDIVFQILIYFVFTFRVDLPEAHLAVNLPSNDTIAGRVMPRLLELQVEPGQVLLMKMPRNLDDIRSVLVGMAKLNPDQTVIIKVNTGARAEELVTVLDMCRGAGLQKLNVLTLK